MRKTAGFLLLTLIISAAGFAQELPSNFTYKRETSEDTGLPFFSLMPDENAMAYDAMRGSTFEALGAMVEPESDIYGLVFVNAKKTYEFTLSRDKSCLLRIDAAEFKYARYTPTFKTKIGQLRIESVAFKINADVYKKIVAANDVFVRCGRTNYSLDQDNIDALRYFGTEVAKDLTRRGKTIK
jgi:hypothetical protein